MVQSKNRLLECVKKGIDKRMFDPFRLRITPHFKKISNLAISSRNMHNERVRHCISSLDIWGYVNRLVY
jgi:hypothetical protein